MELGALLDRCRKKDERAWEILVRRYQPRVFAIAREYAACSEEARDLTRETFLRLHLHLSRCPDADGFLPWVVGTMNVILARRSSGAAFERCGS